VLKEVIRFGGEECANIKSKIIKKETFYRNKNKDTIVQN
jgi:hypothetical protein